MKATAGGWRHEVGGCAVDRVKFLCVEMNNRLQQESSVRVDWSGEDVVNCSYFHNFSSIEYGHSIAYLCNNAEVVSNQQDGHLVPPLQVLKNLEDLRLHDYVKRCCWLVSDQ